MSLIANVEDMILECLWDHHLCSSHNYLLHHWWNIPPYGARCVFFLDLPWLAVNDYDDQFREDFVLCCGFLNIFLTESSWNTTHDGLAEAGFIYSIDISSLSSITTECRDKLSAAFSVPLQYSTWKSNCCKYIKIVLGVRLFGLINSERRGWWSVTTVKRFPWGKSVASLTSPSNS